MASTTLVQESAQWLHDARLLRRAVPQPAGPGMSLQEAYAVQHAGIVLREQAGERRSGLKLGFTSRAKMVQMGVGDMIVGQVTDAMQVTEGDTFPRDRGIHPRVEPEIAFLLGADLGAIDSPAQLQRAVQGVACALEIIDSRYADFRFSLTDVVADNTSACGYVLGTWHSPAIALENVGLQLRIAGRTRVVGSSAAILGNPWRALEAAWRLARQHGIPTPSGSVLLAGAATAAEPLPAHGWVEVDAGSLGRAGFRVT